MLCVVAVATMWMAVNAQQNIGVNTAVIVSPNVQDGVVELFLSMPNAQSVLVQGDWLDAPVAMSRREDGVWCYRSDELLPGMYTYTYNVDGVTMIDPSCVYSVRDVSTLFSYFIVSGGVADNYVINDVSHGTVSSRWYYSDAMGYDRRLTVYIPAGYETGELRYPVLYLLHGMGGDETAWQELGRASVILDNMIASGSVEPMIVVMTNGNVAQQAAPGHSSRGLVPVRFDEPRTCNGEFEAAFGEIISFVDKQYRTQPDAAHRAIAGLSMGGYHSMYISANWPRMFDYVGLFSPAIEARGVHAVYDDIDAKLAMQRDGNMRLYWIAIGCDDFLYKEVADFRDRLDALHFPYTYRESKGGHRWSNWRMYLTEFLPLLFKN